MLRRLSLAVAAGLLCVALISPPQQAQGARPVAAALNRSLPEMNFDGVALSDAIDFVRDITAANIVVNWRALEGAGVTRETLVNLKLRNVSLRKALTLLLSEASAGEGVTYSVDDGVIEITTSELANKKMYTRVYPVGDLLMEIPNFDNAPNFSLDQNQASGGGGSGGGSGGGGNTLFGGGGGGNNRDDENEGPTKEERAEELLTLIKEIIYPDLWTDNGGPASVRMFRDNLVVTAPRKVHEAIGGEWE
jgi:hypothetical protein